MFSLIFMISSIPFLLPESESFSDWEPLFSGAGLVLEPGGAKLVKESSGCSLVIDGCGYNFPCPNSFMEREEIVQLVAVMSQEFVPAGKLGVLKAVETKPISVHPKDTITETINKEQIEAKTYKIESFQRSQLVLEQNQSYSIVLEQVDQSCNLEILMGGVIKASTPWTCSKTESSLSEALIVGKFLLKQMDEKIIGTTVTTQDGKVIINEPKNKNPNHIVIKSDGPTCQVPLHPGPPWSTKENCPNWWFEDLDLDGYGNQNKGALFATPPGLGFVQNFGDEDDQNKHIHPGSHRQK